MECKSICAHHGVYFHPTIECPLIMLHWHHFSWGTLQTNIYLFSNTGSAAAALQYPWKYKIRSAEKQKTDSDTQKTCQHSCMWPLSNVWRLETDAECWVLLAGPGPPQAETHWQKWLMMCAPALQAGPAPVNGPMSDLTWRGSPLASCTPCTPTWARYGAQIQSRLQTHGSSNTSVSGPRFYFL